MHPSSTWQDEKTTNKSKPRHMIQQPNDEACRWILEQISSTGQYASSLPEVEYATEFVAEISVCKAAAPIDHLLQHDLSHDRGR